MSNSGVFDVNDIRYLMDYQQWSGVGTLVLIQTQVGSSVSALDFLNIKENIYDVHFMTVNDFTPSVDATPLSCRFYESGVEESAAVYQYALQFGSPGGVGFNEENSSGIAQIYLCASTGNGTNEVGNSYNYFYNLGDSTKYSFHTNQSTATRPAADYIFTFGSAILPQASTVDGIRVYDSSQTASAGTLSLYGIRYS